MALALVVYSEQFRYEFEVEKSGSGYQLNTTSAFIVDKIAAQNAADKNFNLFEEVPRLMPQLKFPEARSLVLVKPMTKQFKTWEPLPLKRHPFSENNFVVVTKW